MAANGSPTEAARSVPCQPPSTSGTGLVAVAEQGPIVSGVADVASSRGGRVTVSRMSLGLAVAVVAGCTGGAGTVAPTTPPPTPAASSSAAPTPSGDGPTEAVETTSSAVPGTPAPSPSPSDPVTVGVGDLTVRAADGAFVSSDVEGDCLQAGSSLPSDGQGPALGPDVETYVAVDNYLGAFGTPTAPSPLALTIDGSEGQATVSLEGGPASWSWWSGSVTDADLADPVVVDGVLVATLVVSSTVERAEREQVAIRAPRPPRARRTPSVDPESPAPAGGTLPALPARPDVDALATRAGQPAPSSPPGGASPDAGSGTVSPTPAPSATVTRMDVELSITCTLLP